MIQPRTAPAAGPMTNIQNPVYCEPTSAGPNDRAGFTDVPSMPIVEN